MSLDLRGHTHASFESMASTLTWEGARDELRRMRSTRCRESEKALRLGKTLLSDRSSRLGDERESLPFSQVF
jgi:hypothetical protein